MRYCARASWKPGEMTTSGNGPGAGGGAVERWRAHGAGDRAAGHRDGDAGGGQRAERAWRAGVAGARGRVGAGAGRVDRQRAIGGERCVDATVAARGRRVHVGGVIATTAARGEPDQAEEQRDEGEAGHRCLRGAAVERRGERGVVRGDAAGGRGPAAAPSRAARRSPAWRASRRSGARRGGSRRGRPRRAGAAAACRRRAPARGTARARCGSAPAPRRRTARGSASGTDRPCPAGGSRR
jgi:hypothetical protein